MWESRPPFGEISKGLVEIVGSLLELCETKKRKIECARKFFTRITTDQVTYDVVDSYSKLMELVC